MRPGLTWTQSGRCVESAADIKCKRKVAAEVSYHHGPGRPRRRGGGRRRYMSAATVGLNALSYQRLLHLVQQTGQPAAIILDQALADYERKVSAGGNGRPGAVRAGAAGVRVG